MRTLAIDCASTACSVALFDGAVLVSADHRLIGRGHAEQLVPAIAALPDGGRTDRIMVGCGPGSFTGLRVAIAAARALGLAWQVPVTGCSTLALVAARARSQAAIPPDEPVLVVMEGGHGELFVQRFAADGLPLTPMASLLPDAAAVADDTAWVVGNRAADLVARRGGGHAVDALPDARHAMGLHADVTGWAPVPVYGRAPDARPVISADAR